MLAVETKKLSKDFDGDKAVDSIDFAIEAGQIHGFIGPNGAGKTTTIRMLATVLEPSSGDAFIMGHSIIEKPEEARRLIGFVPDWFAGTGSSTVHEYLDFFARACGLRGAHRREAIAEVETITGLDSIADKLITNLSRGMQQRLSVGRALINDPAVLLMDEPAANLDPKARVEFRELVRKLASREKAILISSHILHELSEICDAVTIIDKGRILTSGPIGNVVTADGTIKIKIRALCSRETLERALLGIDGINDVTIAGASIEFELLGGDGKAAEVLKALIGKGLPIVEFSTISSDLESIFMSMTANGSAK